MSDVDLLSELRRLALLNHSPSTPTAGTQLSLSLSYVPRSAAVFSSNLAVFSSKPRFYNPSQGSKIQYQNNGNRFSEKLALENLHL
ncbi:unnamed protein product [Arabis nemorensis]|uniref:Uncharacterized protein n=1 Tax=Arabis nemorensis TaxID=586526 RepID=A0A565ARP5_9BRAS|nr:unnamed protein product [Arabis nemorensis]